MASTLDLLDFNAWLQEMAAAERSDGWLCACADAGRYLMPAAELVAELAGFLASVSADPVLEICGGDGRLASALAARGGAGACHDHDPPAGAPVARVDALTALRRYQPTVVLGAFVPCDAGVDEAVLACPSVEHYVVLGARVGGLLGSPAAWNHAAWHAEPLPRIGRWMLTRHDVWLGESGRPVLQHGEAWHFRRKQKM